MVINNQHFSIYSKVNELAERWDIKPYQLHVYVNMEPGSDNVYINYVSSNKEVSERSKKMILSLDFGGIADYQSPQGKVPIPEFEGSVEDLLKKLDKALSLTPRRIPQKG